jgi:hypothetical protein
MGYQFVEATTQDGVTLVPTDREDVMPLSIVLDEEDLRALPADIRDGLLRSYFAGNRRRQTPAAAPSVLVPITDDDDSGRVTFKKLIAARLLKSGEEIHCRTLKRQQRDGKPKYIKGATVTADGAVEYNGEQFQNPSNLAVAMVKQSGEKPTALNDSITCSCAQARDLWR